MSARTERAAREFAYGETVALDVWRIGNKCDRVIGFVVGHKRGAVIVATECHGHLAPSPGKLTRVEWDGGRTVTPVEVPA